jgi:uncharacterized low-complexity protein
MTMKRVSRRTAVISAALMTAGAIGVVTAGNSSAATYNHDVWKDVYGPTRSGHARAEKDADSIAATCRHMNGYGYPDMSSFEVRTFTAPPLTGYYGALRCYALR